ncbi:hypothetical protein OF83DRAFT_1179388 [Amylostereum chailletii]|nr:hypothetical protein OF83DRAFT_1179388 [Amylostereum chailletii]
MPCRLLVLNHNICRRWGPGLIAVTITVNFIATALVNLAIVSFNAVAIVCTCPVFNAPITIASNALAAVPFNPRVTVAPNALALALALALFAPNRHVTGALNLRVTATLNAMHPSPSNPRRPQTPVTFHSPVVFNVRAQTPHLQRPPIIAPHAQCLRHDSPRGRPRHPQHLHSVGLNAYAFITSVPSLSTHMPRLRPTRHSSQSCHARCLQHPSSSTLVPRRPWRPCRCRSERPRCRHPEWPHLPRPRPPVADALNSHPLIALNTDTLAAYILTMLNAGAIVPSSPTLAHTLITSTHLPPSPSPNTPPPRSAPAPLPHSTPVPVPVCAHALVPPPMAKPQCIAHAPRVPHACVLAINACTKAGSLSNHCSFLPGLMQCI